MYIFKNIFPHFEVIFFDIIIYMSHVSGETFIGLASTMLPQIKITLTTNTIQRRFKSSFGVPPDICVILWRHIFNHVMSCTIPIHLLWALLFLKLYNNLDTNSSIAGVDQKTFQKHTWDIIRALSSIDIVSLYIFIMFEL